MRLHANARLSVKGRQLLVERVEVAGWSLSAAAEAAGISERTARKWLARYRAEGESGLSDRSSAPAVVANRTDERRIEAIAALRRLRLTGAEIAEVLGMALSTASGILTRIGMGELGRLGLASIPHVSVGSSFAGGVRSGWGVVGGWCGGVGWLGWLGRRCWVVVRVCLGSRGWAAWSAGRRGAGRGGQPGAGSARSRAKAASSALAQGQRAGRCRVRRRPE